MSSSPSLTSPAALAHIVPFAVFLVITSIAGAITSSDVSAPWYLAAPQHWVYPLQCVIVGGLLLFYRRFYVFTPVRGLALAAVLGLAGIAAWIAPSMLVAPGQPEWYTWLGITPRLEGFTPDVFPPQSPAWWTTVLLRFVRLVVIVPFIEEIFWRGFLMRVVQAGDRDFRDVPFGQHSWAAYGIVTGAVVLAHNPPDYLGAFVWGSLMYWLAVRTKSLAACVAMHAVGNLALGLWIMRTGQWGFW